MSFNFKSEQSQGPYFGNQISMLETPDMTLVRWSFLIKASKVNQEEVSLGNVEKPHANNLDYSIS